MSSAHFFSQNKYLTIRLTIWDTNKSPNNKYPAFPYNSLIEDKSEQLDFEIEYLDAQHRLCIAIVD